jgi:hypothetical protein
LRDLGNQLFDDSVAEGIEVLRDHDERARAAVDHDPLGDCLVPCVSNVAASIVVTVTLTGRSQTFREILDRMEPRGVAEFRSILYRGRKAI